jgi:hypothetical protein
LHTYVMVNATVGGVALNDDVSLHMQIRETTSLARPPQRQIDPWCLMLPAAGSASRLLGSDVEVLRGNIRVR